MVDAVIPLPVHPSPPIPAATLVLMRDRRVGAPDLLMVERSRALAFAGGALVFPGGRVDPGDRALAAALDGDPEELAARLAAIRETVEEVGIAVGIGLAPGAVASLRSALHAGVPLGPALAATDARLDATTLTPLARWCPAQAQALVRRFDTRFFLAAAPADAAGSIDATENVRLVWASAAGHLAAAARGDAEMIFPTRRVLERLATFSSLAAAVADAAVRPARTVTPWEELRNGVPHLCIPDDLGYPVTAEPLTHVRRG